MDLTAVQTEAIYQEQGKDGITTLFDCEVICTTAEDYTTGENADLLMIHGFNKNFVISLELYPVLLAVNLHKAKRGR